MFDFTNMENSVMKMFKSLWTPGSTTIKLFQKSILPMVNFRALLSIVSLGLVEYFIERQGDPKTLPRSPQKSVAEKKPEITLLSKRNWDTTDPDVIHFRCYIKLLRNIIRRMKEENQHGTTISAIDKYIQQNFWLEGVELGEFKSQLRLAIGRGVTANLLVRTSHDSNKFHRIELGSDDSEDEEESEENSQGRDEDNFDF